MNNELYRKVLVPSYDSADGEQPTLLLVTEETNCYAVWEHGFLGRELIKWFSLGDREAVLEFAIAIVPEQRAKAIVEIQRYLKENSVNAE